MQSMTVTRNIIEVMGLQPFNGKRPRP